MSQVFHEIFVDCPIAAAPKSTFNCIEDVEKYKNGLLAESHVRQFSLELNRLPVNDSSLSFAACLVSVRASASISSSTA